MNHQVDEDDPLGEREMILGSSEMYVVSDNTWLPLPDMIYGSYDHASAYNDGILYVTGGISDNPNEPIPTDSAYILKVREEAVGWEPMRGMLYPRQGHSLTAHNNCLYAIGGYTSHPDPTAPGFQDCYNNEVYDIETNQWTEIASTPPSFQHLLRSVALFTNSKIYILGNGNLGSYDIEKNSFECLEYFSLFIHKLTIMNASYPIENI